MGEVEEESGLQGTFGALESLPPGVVVEAKCVVATGLVDVVVVIFCLSEQFIVDADGLPGSAAVYLYSPMWK